MNWHSVWSKIADGYTKGIDPRGEHCDPMNQEDAETAAAIDMMDFEQYFDLYGY